MDVSMDSPPRQTDFCSTYTPSLKRPRSPSSPTQAPRPSKRPVVVDYEPFTMHATLYEDIGPDVRRLRLDSASSASSRSPSRSPLRTNEGKPTQQDDQMMLSEEGPPVILNLPSDMKMNESPAQSSFASRSTSYTSSSSSLVPFERPSATFQHSLSHASSFVSPPNHFFRHHSSPQTTTAATYPVYQSAPLPASPSHQGTHMTTDPPTSHPASPPRRTRMTMGPRADCAKCRMKVPGHWMHMD